MDAMKDFCTFRRLSNRCLQIFTASAFHISTTLTLILFSTIRIVSFELEYSEKPIYLLWYAPGAIYAATTLRSITQFDTIPLRARAAFLEVALLCALSMLIAYCFQLVPYGKLLIWSIACLISAFANVAIIASRKSFM